MKRVISLLGSATEIVCALGAQSALVGRSHECDYPATVKSLPSCTDARIDVSASSVEIDAQVKNTLREALSIYRVRVDLLNELKPDLIITQTQCEVCAVSLKDVEDALCRMIGAQPAIVSLNPNALSDVWIGILDIAKALGLADRGHELVATMQARMKTIADHAGDSERPKVACIEWIEPLMAAGNWVPELVELAGGDNLFGQAGKHSPWMTWEQLRDADPDLIIVMPCGFDLPRTRREMPTLTSKPGWDRLRAVRNRLVFVADGNAYFNRPGPRLVEALEMLAEAIRPGQYCFGHDGLELL